MSKLKVTNRVIALVDDSDMSSNLVAFAVEFSNVINASVVLAHRTPGMVPAMSDPESRKEILESEILDALERLHRMCDKINFSDGRFVVRNKPVLEILHELRSPNHRDWVIVGLKPAGAMKRIFVGATAISVIDNTDFITIAIPLTHPVHPPTKILMGVHPRFPVNNHQLDIVVQSLSGQIAETELFSVLTDHESEFDARAHLDEIKTHFNTMKTNVSVLRGDAEHLLKSLAQGLPDAFLMIQQGPRHLQDTFVRTLMVNELAFSASIPFITLPR